MPPREPISLLPSALRRFGLALTALGLAFVGALLVLRAVSPGWGLIALGLPLSLLLALAGDALGRDFAGTLRARWAGVTGQMRPWMWWGVGYVALKIPVPLWPEGFPLLGLLSTAALFVAGLTCAAERVGWRRAAGMAALAFAVGLGVELLGSRTGIPFGQYTYAGAPAPTLLSVPLIVPLGWFALTLAATVLARGRAWLAGVLLVGWDVGLEPLMTAQGYWQWTDAAPLWAGAPVQNFLGWWGVGAGLAWAFTRIAPGMFREESTRATPGPSRPSSFALAYPVEMFFLPGGLVLVGRAPEAAVTLGAMLAAYALARGMERRG